MEKKLKTICDSATPEALELLEMRDALLASFRVEAGGVDVTEWGPNGPKSTPERDEAQRLELERISAMQADGAITDAEAHELRALVLRIMGP